MIQLINKNTELIYDKYVKRGSLMVLRAALPLDDPDLLYNYLKESSVLKDAHLTPEDFGVYHPVSAAYKDKTKEELLSVITDLIIENENLHRNSR